MADTADRHVWAFLGDGETETDDKCRDTTWQEPRQRRQRHAVGGLEPGTTYLPSKHRNLMAQHQEFDVLGPSSRAS